ncbi:MAG: aminoacyl-tRNA hydrolase [Acidobacteria bacterium]|nr:aminoacyl-tRNA hydrolase [Acidobacteriota bacterium]
MWAMWTLLPLGNPGSEYSATRHNLGRLMLQRWIEDRGLSPKAIQEFQTGRLYRLNQDFQALVPGSFMNLSGQTAAEAAASGLPLERMLLLMDDKDLPLGRGRLRLFGSDGGHRGLRSVQASLGTQNVARLRLGIGPFTRPLHDFVLGEWTEAEWEALDRLDAPFGHFLEALAGCDSLGDLPNQVNWDEFWARAS